MAFEDAPVTMASEDYGYLISRIPGMMFWLGVGPGPSAALRKVLARREGD